MIFVHKILHNINQFIQYYYSIMGTQYTSVYNMLVNAYIGNVKDPHTLQLILQT